MNIYSMEPLQMKELKCEYTATEIFQQPSTWRKTLNQIKNEKEQIAALIKTITSNEDYEIIFTGAGTSEFVGNSVFTAINQVTGYHCRSYGTTDLVASPEHYFCKTRPTLLVSFARSGNSPESVGAVQAAEAVLDQVAHLFITCNKNGALSKMAEKQSNCYAINLTDETHDQSFAMTSSFSNMALAALLSFNLDMLDELEPEVESMMKQSEKVLQEDWSCLKALAEKDFNRIVYLGANVFKGIAQESALKMLELTAGKVVTMFDTPLGFRHGPKSIVNEKTLTVVYLSDDEYSYQYELDLIKEMSAEHKGCALVVIGNKEREELKGLTDFCYFLNSLSENSVLLGLQYIVMAQLIALFKSLSLNITPDNPCPTGEVNRVVKGVTIYPYTK